MCGHLTSSQQMRKKVWWLVQESFKRVDSAEEPPFLPSVAAAVAIMNHEVTLRMEAASQDAQVKSSSFDP